MPKKNEPLEVSASDLKNSWHEFLERVSRARQEVVVTRSVTVHGDIIAPVGDVWDADA